MIEFFGISCALLGIVNCGAAIICFLRTQLLQGYLMLANFVLLAAMVQLKVFG